MNVLLFTSVRVGLPLLLTPTLYSRMSSLLPTKIM